MSSTPTSETSNSDEIQLANPKAADIISTLAKENGWSPHDNHPLYFYKGVWYHGVFIPVVIAAQAQGIPGFNPSSSDIIISSCPKSGTTWLKALSFAIATRTRFPTKHCEDIPLHSTNPHELIPMIEAISMCNNPDLPLFSTHFPYTSLPSSILASGCKIVYIWRDPKDVFISFWHYAHKIGPNKDVTNPVPLKEAFDLFCRGVFPFGPYWDHVLGYWKAFLDHPDKILILKYEDMMNDVEVHVKRLAEFMGYPFSSAEEKEGVIARIVAMCSFESLSNVAMKKVGDNEDLKRFFSLAHDSFFRKGKIGDWKNYLTEEMASKIDQITIDKLGTHGLTL